MPMLEAVVRMMSCLFGCGLCCAVLSTIFPQRRAAAGHPPVPLHHNRDAAVYHW